MNVCRSAAELERMSESRRLVREELSELDTAQRLQEMATQLIDGHGIRALYEQILDTVLTRLRLRPTRHVT